MGWWGWNGNVRLSRAALRNLVWWTDVPARWQGRAIWRPTEDAEMHCDASNQGWGAMLNGALPAYGIWAPTDASLHITTRSS